MRFWNIDHGASNNPCSSISTTTYVSPTASPSTTPDPQSSMSSLTSSPWRKNIYSRELVKMLYVDNDFAELAKLQREIG